MKGRVERRSRSAERKADDNEGSPRPCKRARVSDASHAVEEACLRHSPVQTPLNAWADLPPAHSEDSANPRNLTPAIASPAALPSTPASASLSCSSASSESDDADTDITLITPSNSASASHAPAAIPIRAGPTARPHHPGGLLSLTDTIPAAPTTARPALTLVGAGPGSPGLLTVAAIEALRQATLIIADRLVPPAILRHALGDKSRTPTPAPHVMVARKVPGRAKEAQDEIDDWMVRGLLLGHRVVRLKGGDPFVFGRGGEEVIKVRERLEEAMAMRGAPGGTEWPLWERMEAVAAGGDGNDGVFAGTWWELGQTGEDADAAWDAIADGGINAILQPDADVAATAPARKQPSAPAQPRLPPIRVIPGLSSSFSAPLLAGIPVTHRGVADQVFVATGQRQDGSLPSLPPYHPSRTAVLLMAMGKVDALVAAMVGDGVGKGLGYSAMTPTVIVERAGCEGMRVVRCVLRDVPEKVAEAGISCHATLVVGDVADVLL
ncbi:uroporphyrin-III C-methyltransferase [Phlyctochytrium bullatum]|nr:uroporphyrin-III C-methyltransferase [Phlyctochytrium bullatum]